MRGESYYEDVFGLDASGNVFQARVRTAVHADGDDCSWSAIIVGPNSGGALHVINAVDVKRNKTKTLYKNADFKVSGRCVNNGMGDFTADTSLQARRNNLAYYAYDDGTDLDFDPNDGKIDFTSTTRPAPIPTSSPRTSTPTSGPRARAARRSTAASRAASTSGAPTAPSPGSSPASGA